ncbi:MAG: hypothetical protein EZS28_019478, partial [Streblomastix strix]
LPPDAQYGRISDDQLPSDQLASKFRILFAAATNAAVDRRISSDILPYYASGGNAKKEEERDTMRLIKIKEAELKQLRIQLQNDQNGIRSVYKGNEEQNAISPQSKFLMPRVLKPITTFSSSKTLIGNTGIKRGFKSPLIQKENKNFEEKKENITNNVSKIDKKSITPPNNTKKVHPTHSSSTTQQLIKNAEEELANLRTVLSCLQAPPQTQLMDSNENKKDETNWLMSPFLRLIGATCSATCFPAFNTAPFSSPNVLILDEASQMTEPVSILPLLRCYSIDTQNNDETTSPNKITPIPSSSTPNQQIIKHGHNSDIILPQSSMNDRSLYGLTLFVRLARSSLFFKNIKKKIKIKQNNQSKNVLINTNYDYNNMTQEEQNDIGDSNEEKQIIFPSTLDHSSSSPHNNSIQTNIQLIPPPLYQHPIPSPPTLILLRTQFRCHPSIGTLSNLLFYCGSLKNGTVKRKSDTINNSNNNNVISSHVQPILPFLHPIVFVDTYGTEEYSSESMGFSYANEGEAKRIASFLHALLLHLQRLELLDSNRTSSSVKTGVARLKQNSRLALPGIVSPRSAIESEWERVSTFFSLQLATVDSFQGQERDIIILSTCRTKLGSGGFTSGGSGMIEKLYDSLMNNDTNETGSKKFESFLASPQRLAVAITRARAHLIVFGSGQVLSHAPLWSNILNTARKQKRRVLVFDDGNKEQIINKQKDLDILDDEQD